MAMRQVGALFAVAILVVVGFISFSRLTGNDSLPQQNDQLASALTALANKEKEIDRLMLESKQIKDLSDKLVDNKQTLEAERRRKEELSTELESLKTEVKRLVTDFRALMQEASALIRTKNTESQSSQSSQYAIEGKRSETQPDKEEIELVTKQPIIKTNAVLHDQRTCFKHNLIILSKQRSGLSSAKAYILASVFFRRHFSLTHPFHRTTGSHFLKSLLDQHPASL